MISIEYIDQGCYNHYPWDNIFFVFYSNLSFLSTALLSTQNGNNVLGKKTKDITILLGRKV